MPKNYNLIKNNYDKWLWGADETGDITKSQNIRWYKNYINNKWLERGEKLDLLTGDAGTNSSFSSLILQKLDLGQAIAIIACSSKSGSCVVKHFSPYITTEPDTLKATGFFISYIYLYYVMFEEISLFKPYTSDATSGEFSVSSVLYLFKISTFF